MGLRLNRKYSLPNERFIVNPKVNGRGFYMTDIDFIGFARNLKKLRKRNDLSQQELADKVGISKQSIFNYENGKKKPSQETIEKIANALHVSKGYLLSGTTDLLVQREFAQGTPEFEYTQARTNLAFNIGRRALITEYLENEKVNISDIENFLDSYEIPIKLIKNLNLEEKIDYLKFTMTNEIEKLIKDIEKNVLEDRVFEATYGWDFWSPKSKN